MIDPGPLRPRLEWPARIAYVVGAMVVGWMLAITLVLVPHPLYAHYADLLPRPGGISALTDQQLAGGVMWVLGSIAYTVVALIGFYRWLEPESTSASPSRAHHLRRRRHDHRSRSQASSPARCCRCCCRSRVLIALVVWYVVVVRRRFAGDPGDPSEPEAPLTDPSHATAGIGKAPEQKT